MYMCYSLLGESEKISLKIGKTDYLPQIVSAWGWWVTDHDILGGDLVIPLLCTRQG